MCDRGSDPSQHDAVPGAIHEVTPAEREQRIVDVYHRASARHTRRLQAWVIGPGAARLNVSAEHDRLLREAHRLVGRIVALLD